MNYSDLFSKLRQAAVGICASNAPQYTVLDGGVNTLINAPYAVAFAENANEEDPQNSGNFWANFQFEVHYNSPTDVDGVDPKPGFDLMTKILFDLFMSTTLRDDLNAVGIADFTAIGVRERNTGFHIVGDQWVNVLTMQILCCPSTVYP